MPEDATMTLDNWHIHCPAKHTADHIKHHGLRSDSTLYVVGVVSNPVRYNSRYRIAREWIQHMAHTPHVQLVLVEAAFGDRHWEVTDECNDFHIRLNTRSEAWIKENMINIGMRAVLAKHPSAKYLAWVDADVFFRTPGWALETIHQLQHFSVVQPWQDCLDLGPHGNVFQHFKSFGYQHQMRVPKQKWPGQPYPYAHSGFAWACTRHFWENVRGLCEVGILGSSDHHMAFAMIGEVRDTIHSKMAPSFFRICEEWQRRATRVTHNEVGFVHGRIEHQFHGPKKRRYYRERWQLLWENGYDPDTDIMYDEQGLLHIVGKPALEQAIRLYNRSRLEDSNEET